jgi:hypothetical protein
MSTEMTTTCAYCRGQGTVQNMHNWSDGWGMVDSTCPLCDGTGRTAAVLTIAVTQKREAERLAGELRQLKAHVALYLATERDTLPWPPLQDARRPSPWPETWRGWLEQAVADLPRVATPPAPHDHDFEHGATSPVHCGGCQPAPPPSAGLDDADLAPCPDCLQRGMCYCPPRCPTCQRLADHGCVNAAGAGLWTCDDDGDWEAPAPGAPLAVPPVPAPGRCPICLATVPAGQVYCQEEGDLIDGHTSLECQDATHEHCTGRWIDTGHVLLCACACHADPQPPAAREAAQRADECAYCETTGEHAICPQCGDEVCPDRPCIQCAIPAAQRADEAELLRPESDRYPVGRPERGCPECATDRHDLRDCPKRLRPGGLHGSHEGTPEGDAARWLANRGLPPMAGGSGEGGPSHWQTHSFVLTDAYTGLPRYCRVVERSGTLHTLTCGHQTQSPSTLYHPGAPMPCLPCTQAYKALAARGLPPMAGGAPAEAERCYRCGETGIVTYYPDGYRHARCGAPTPADEPAGPGAPLQARRCDHCGALRDRGSARHVCCYAHRCALCEPDRDEEALCAPMSASTTAPTVTATGATRGAVAGPSITAAPTAACAAIGQTTEHTHPCPTCHQARPCTATGCADGPRECSTCSQCRGW